MNMDMQGQGTSHSGPPGPRHTNGYMDNDMQSTSHSGPPGPRHPL